MMAEQEISNIVNDIIGDHGIPKNIRNSLENSLSYIRNQESEQEKVAFVISILDEASNDPNISLHARTKIWSVVSHLEGMR